MLSRRSRAVAALTALLTIGAVVGTPPSVTEIRAASSTRDLTALDTPRSVTLDQAIGEQTRPNIVVITADDMRDDDLQYLPRTRSLLGDRGVRFVNSFSPHPLCCPARASFLTGKYTHNHHVWSNHGSRGGFVALDDSATMPVGMQSAGYNTVFLGKYLNGYGKLPLADGSPSVTYVPPGWTDWRAAARGTYNYFDTTLNVNGDLRDHPGWYQTRMLGAESRDLINQHARSPRPFFLWASYVAPHVGRPAERDDPVRIDRENGYVNKFQTPAVPSDVRGLFDAIITAAPGDAGETDVSDKPFFIRNQPPADPDERAALTEVTRQRAESLEVLDQEVEATVQALERTGQLDDTLLIFTADNGYLLGEHRIRQGKLLPYEPSLRVPLLVRGPGIPTGQVRTDPVLTIDFAPTFLELAGAQPDAAMDGASFLEPPQTGDATRDTGWTRSILTETGPRARRNKSEDGSPIATADRLRFTQGVRTGRYLYVEHATGERELYDLRSDPDQLDNIFATRPAELVERQMAALLDQMRNCRGEDCRKPAPSSLHR